MERQNQVESSRMGRKLRGKCRNDCSSCFSISRTVVCQVSKTRYIHKQVLYHILFSSLQGHFSSQDQAFPDCKLERKLVSIDNWSLKCVDFTRKEKNPKPKILKCNSLDWPFWSVTHICANHLAVYFG